MTQNTKPNWEEAPKDATHWGPETELFFSSWYKKDGESWSCCDCAAFKHFGSSWYGLGRDVRRNDLEQRP